ncbi:DUF4838 domain-containing protein [Horticoccus luteus]|uniref:DUF4838 domain-containing protein n=1 Tax=Horticoccus luteus TaxID=2862869 RepID=A0A8F9TVJ0_9BACT|nr:DUF4838 domain-containing protein [Horticoccus luteus]QYM78558.1 DUF4838 domain-containing protein [Horticoccus luteus]
MKGSFELHPRRGWALVLAGALFAVQIACGSERPIVAAGQARATVVVPGDASPVVRYAAQELVEHIAKASGVTLPIMTEADGQPGDGSHFFLGATRAAENAGIDAAALAPETFVLRTIGPDVYIVGGDLRRGGPGTRAGEHAVSDALYNPPEIPPGDPLNMNTPGGTMFGVYEWLERELGVRWLWPGELGTFVPVRHEVVAHDWDETVAPRFFQRLVRPGLGFTSDHPALGFTPAAAEKYAHEQSVFLRRCRMGRGTVITYHHAFTDWWEKYGEDHPEWFQLVNGKRGPMKPGGRFSMSVSEPGLQQKIVDLWQAERTKPTGTNPHYINAVENDILGLCECEGCRAWDGPVPADAMKFYSPKSKVFGARFVSDRYAHFWLAVQQLAAKHDPDATVVGYVYFNYFQAPTSGIKLNDHILLGYCPSGGWYPRSPEEHAWFKRQWRGWADTGARLFSRTNYFLDGYCMPFIFAHQFADDFQSEVRNGMVATDFDSLTGQWATQGPDLYLLMRLHTRPDADPDELLSEYYAAFGPAATEVKAYFDYWENYTMGHRAQINEAFDSLHASRWRTWAKAAHAVYPTECFAAGEAMLAKAAAACADDRTAAERVAFLQAGLVHAKLSSRVAGLLSLARPDGPAPEGKEALAELLAFRRAHEFSGIANFNHEAWVEDLSWTLGTETKQAPELYP